ncbi:MAG: molybdopterin-dependent oxidoreductase [Candidatus Omnitrophota bacterium]
MIRLKIDGQTVEVEKGTKVIEAAKRAGIDIPFYCYHPGLSIAGNCRMCLVEVEKMPKLQASCHLEASEGMVVWTSNARVMATRRHVLEFLLVNHPVDCPVCDQAGECWLQDYYLRYGAYDSRVGENKVKKKKAVPVGPTVMLDAERCILCSRCVRFTEEITRTHELGIVKRGDHAEITVFPGKELNNPYSGNVVDLCPVGALTDRDFRFKVRAWYLRTVPTLCNGCSRGCSIFMQTRKGRPHHAEGQRVMRIKPRYHEAVNRWWICDEGRYGYRFHDQERILSPLSRENGRLRKTTWESAVRALGELLRKAQRSFGVLLSPQLSNEELYLGEHLFRKELHSENLFLLSPTAPGFQDELLIRADKNPNTLGGEWMGLSADPGSRQRFFEACGRGEIEGLVIFGQDLLSLREPAAGEAVLEKLKWTVFIGPNQHPTSERADWVLPSATYAEKEGTFTNFEGRVQKFNLAFPPLGEARPEWQILCALAAGMGIRFPFDRTGDIFRAMVKHHEKFKGMSWDALETDDGGIRRFASPMIPELIQDSPLVFPQEGVRGGGV